MVYVDLDEKKEVDAGADNSVSAKTSVLVPKIVSVICSELSRRHLGQEGLFRKSGSSFRQKQLRDALECASPEAWVNIVRGNSTSGGGSDVVVSGLDLAAILKQWLRELPEPLIPRKFQLLFIEWVFLSLISSNEFPKWLFLQLLQAISRDVTATRRVLGSLHLSPSHQ